MKEPGLRNNTFLLTALFAVFLLLLFFIALTCHWFGSAIGVGGNFCEAARNGLLVQPVNTISNIGFITAGLYCAKLITYSTETRNNIFYTTSFFPVFFCFLIVLLGPCSAAMHATETRIGGRLDMNSMYLFSGFMLAYSSSRLFKMKPVYFTLIFALSIIFCNIAGLYHTVFGLDFYPGNAAFGLTASLGMVFEFLNYKKNKPVIQFRYALYCSISFLVAFGLWHFGYDGHCFCHPYSWFQWHGVWHLLCALSAYFLFRYYISEDSVS